MSSPDPTRRPGLFHGPGDAEPEPIRPDMVAEDQAAATWRRARRRDLLARLGIALGGLLVATVLLLVLAAVQISQRPDPPTTVPAPVTVPAPGFTGTSGYIPVPAGKPWPLHAPERRHLACRSCCIRWSSCSWWW